MPIKYVGRTTWFKGKTLWEIVGNLRNYGVGRIVARNIFKRYSEPSYYKILSVETLPAPEVETLDDLRKVRVVAETVFRGKKFTEPTIIEGTSYKSDYILIPKDEEATFCRESEVTLSNSKQEKKILPKTMEFPPLMRELIIRENKAKGVTNPDEPRLEIVYNAESSRIKYKIQDENEKPTVQYSMGLGKPASPGLYANIKS